MHTREDGRQQATVTWKDDKITDWIENYVKMHDASDSQAIKYALRNQAQADQ